MNAIRLALVAALFLLVLTACQDGSKITGTKVRLTDSFKPEQEAALKNVWADDQPGSDIFDKNADNPGYIMLANDARNLYISYYLADNWQLSGGEVEFIKMSPNASANGLGLSSHKHMILAQCENVYTQVIPLAELHLKPGDSFGFDSTALIYGNNAAEGTSLPPELCVPGQVDRQWQLMGTGTLGIDPNSPQQRIKIEFKPLFSENRKA